MRLITLRDDSPRCDNGRTCPHISATDRQTLIVQGYVTAAPGTPSGEIAIEVPLTLLPELAAEPGTGLQVTGRGTVVFHGPAVSDPDTLAELTIPPGEAAIEIPAAVLPFLEVAGHA
ncbi:MAG: hypothetical protein ACRDNW_12115 [Trebonia sp.]